MVNGGFEDENICTEFHINCAPEGWISTADTYNNFFKIPALAYRGQHCVAIEAGHSKKQFSRTYIRSQLLCRLRKGHHYKIELYAKSRHNILDSAGLYFTDHDFLFDKQVRHRIKPSVYLIDAIEKPRRSDTNWQRVSIDYTASGKEVYLTLGNFSKRDITGETGIRLENHFFVFFDDVSLVAKDSNEKICSNWQEMKQQLYDFDPRHQLLELYIKRYINNPPDPPEISLTSVQKIESLTIPDVLFAVDKSDLTQSTFHLLDSLCERLIGRQLDSIVVEGHTDSTGTLLHNEQLSLDRAISVANYVRGKLLLRRHFVTARGLASQKPVADNRTAIGRQLNRRVEIFIYIRQ